MLLVSPQIHRIVDWFMCVRERESVIRLTISAQALFIAWKSRSHARLYSHSFNPLYVRSIAIADANKTLRRNILSMYIVHTNNIGQPMYLLYIEQILNSNGNSTSAANTENCYLLRLFLTCCNIQLLNFILSRLQKREKKSRLHWLHRTNSNNRQNNRRAAAAI